MRIRTRVLLPAALAGAALLLFTGAPGQAAANRSPAGVTATASVEVAVHGFLLAGTRLILVDFPGAQATFPTAINDRGRIAGSYLDAGSPARHGFIHDKLGTKSFDVPGSTGTFPLDINDNNEIVGGYLDAAGRFQGFLLAPGGIFTSIDVPGSLQTVVIGINDLGEMVGAYVDSAGRQHGFVSRGEAVLTVDHPEPGQRSTVLSQINDRGVILGNYIPATTAGPRGFLITDRVFTAVDVPGAVANNPNGLNNRSTVVGFYRDAANARHGYIFRQGQVTTVDVPGGVNTQFHDINDNDQIVGSFETVPTGARPAPASSPQFGLWLN